MTHTAIPVERFNPWQVDKKLASLEVEAPKGNLEIQGVQWDSNAEDALGEIYSGCEIDPVYVRGNHVVLTLEDLIPIERLKEWDYMQLITAPPS